MKKNPAFLLIITFFISLPVSSFAWGKIGHGIVAEIAFALIDSTTKQNVIRFLGTTTIQGASTWMDEVRSDHKFDYMKTWHYVNIEKGNQYVTVKEPNVINALNNAIDQLGHKDQLTDVEIKTNLMVIFHLTGDMHQPLHVGYGTDKGGNDIQVKYLGHPNNLHRVWDTEIIEGEGITANQCLLHYKDFDKDELAALREINIEKWIYQPRSLLSKVYNFKQEDNSIDQIYIDRNKQIIEQQLLVAGIRLAAILKKVAG